MPTKSFNNQKKRNIVYAKYKETETNFNSFQMNL